MKEAQYKNKAVFSLPAILLASAAFVFSAVVLFVEVGPWESVRQSFAGWILAAAWLMSAKLILAEIPVPDHIQVKHSIVEAALMTSVLAVMISIAALGYLNILDLSLVAYLSVTAGLVIAIQLVSGYGIDSLGLRFPARREWILFLVIVLINVLFVLIYRQIPAGEAATPSGADLAEEISGPLSVVILIGSLLLGAALPEELVLRVGLQPRLAAIFGISVAIVLQALLFSFGHLPQQILRYERSPLLALAYLLPIENGLIAGYVWYRTKNLPIILLLHLFAFPRFSR